MDKHRTLIYKIRALEPEGEIIIHSNEMVTISLSENNVGGGIKQ